MTKTCCESDHHGDFNAPPNALAACAITRARARALISHGRQSSYVYYTNTYTTEPIPHGTNNAMRHRGSIYYARAREREVGVVGCGRDLTTGV